MSSLTLLEYSANAFFLISVFLAARNHRHTWTLGIVGCVLFAVLFFQVQLNTSNKLGETPIKTAAMAGKVKIKFQTAIYFLY